MILKKFNNKFKILINNSFNLNNKLIKKKSKLYFNISNNL